jgi:RNA recognition motif-containing protein
MLQAGRIVNVHLPKDRVTQTHQGYGFVEFISEEDAEYAARIMNQVRLYGKPIRVNKVYLPRFSPYSFRHLTKSAEEIEVNV